MDNTIKMCKLLTKLSSKDFKKNIQLNLYYVVMIVMYSAIMYGINIIYSKDYVIQHIEYFNVDNILLMTRIMAGCFFLLALGIILYLDNYLFNYQKNKYYLLRTMGLSRRIISYKILVERLIGSIIGLLIGIIIGTIFNYFLTKYILEVMETTITISFKLYKDALALTILGNAILLLVTFIKNVKRFKSIELKELLTVEKKIKIGKIPSVKANIISIIVIGIMGIGVLRYYDYVQHLQEIPDNVKNLLIFLVIILAILAIRSFIYAGINLQTRKRLKKQYHSIEDIILLTELTTYSKRLKFMMFSSSIILLFCIVVPVMANILFTWSHSFNQYKGSYDIEVNSIYNYIKEPDKIGEIEIDFLNEYLESQDVHANKFIKVKNYLANPDLFKNRRRGMFPPYIISLDDYNCVRSASGLEKVSLNKDEFLVHKYKTEQNVFSDKKIVLSNGVTLKNSQKEFTDSVAGESLFNTDNPYVIVVNAYAVEGLLKVSETVLIDTQDRITYSQAEKIEKDILTELNNSEIYESNRKYNKEDDFFKIFEVTMQTISNNQFVTFTILVNLLSIYLFIIGMVLNLSILSLNYLFIMRSHVDNIKVYRRLGVNEKESSDIRKKESRYIYTTPLVCAGVFLSIILGVYISLNYAEIHAYVSIKGVILNASRYLLLVIGMTVLYAFITMRIIKKGEKDTYVQ
ncbi:MULTISPECIES: FtsX-like permease family protein [Lachnospiraceae]|uniref:FtsX-like permease family protein n=1 Tax=Lachnospiraceae TaxID=186803 RepID=UPI001D091CAA|nr:MULTISPECIES: FtsX-like permease family protein [Lachnospiraceae]MCB5914674.1 FtsX-like permease family protein [Lachnospiraceae bacterium 210521-DFI.5.19]MCB6545649.1 FtsX-like permease family protein [Blautia glucerasea]MCB6620966.1 FtsX-like permease family protein [Mediterraneibacter sp. 210702-DFI.5.30]MCB6689946.1 FtsX-like permease family protein [Blautia wexlerae]MCG4797841.1 FtsX-like permease family protein [Dorea longicatena]